VRLLGKDAAAPAARRGSAGAHNLYLQGKYFSQRPTSEGYEKAISYCEQALRLDPGYAPAWAGLADARQWHAGNSARVLAAAALHGRELS
jgi:tetratricopeptide (TPR) repeat protein